jgi:hypothetical protein
MPRSPRFVLAAQGGRESQNSRDQQSQAARFGDLVLRLRIQLEREVLRVVAARAEVALIGVHVALRRGLPQPLRWESEIRNDREPVHRAGSSRKIGAQAKNISVSRIADVVVLQEGLSGISRNYVGGKEATRGVSGVAPKVDREAGDPACGATRAGDVGPNPGDLVDIGRAEQREAVIRRGEVAKAPAMPAIYGALHFSKVRSTGITEAIQQKELQAPGPVSAFALPAPTTEAEVAQPPGRGSRQSPLATYITG